MSEIDAHRKGQAAATVRTPALAAAPLTLRRKLVLLENATRGMIPEICMRVNDIVRCRVSAMKNDS